MTGAIHADLIDVKAQVTALANLLEGLTPEALKAIPSRAFPFLPGMSLRT
jgi:hypothetical protein